MPTSLPTSITTLLTLRSRFPYAVPVEVGLFSAIEKEARKHGVNVEPLVSLWLQEKLAEQV